MDFQALDEPRGDPILQVMLAYRADTRPGKIDLGVGIFKDAAGQTPIMAAVQQAGARLLADEETKAYTAIPGDAGFLSAMREMVLGDAVPEKQVVTSATTGGSQAVRLLCDLIKVTSPDATLWISDPSWPNHPVISDGAGLKRKTYRYFDSATRGVDCAAMLADLEQAKRGDIVLLHASCHNPTGADLSADDWAALADLLEARGLVAMIDNAYQGFGDGLEEDAQPLRKLAARLPVVLIATSCSKNFGIYRERAGLLLVTCRDESVMPKLKSTMVDLARRSYSFPPDHGARLVTTIWNDADLRQSWQSELEANRLQVSRNRQMLAEALRRESNSDRFDFLAAHRGMFSLLGATPAQVERLREEHGIYIIGDSRMNVAGLVPKTIEALARAIVAVGV